MSNAEITVLVPTYNHERHIRSAIESVMRQTAFPHCHVVVSDDCSSDGTYKLAQAVANGNDRLVVRRNRTNLGVMEHYRSLISELSTPFAAILEGDDMWISDQKLESQLNFLKHRSDVAMCFSACIAEYEGTSTRDELPSWNDGRNRIIDLIDLLYDNPIATFSNCFYRSQALKSAFASSDIAEGYDWLCTLKIASSSPIGFLAKPSTLYRIHQGGVWSRMSKRQRKQAMRKTLQAYLQSDASLSVRTFVHDAMRRIS